MSYSVRYHIRISENVCRWELKSQRFCTSRWRVVNTHLLHLSYKLSSTQRQHPNQQQQEEEKDAAQQQQQLKQGQQSLAAAAAGASSSVP